MTILKPKDTPSPYAGSSEYYESYIMLESDLDLGTLHHNAIVSVALYAMKQNPLWSFHIKNVRTQVYNVTPPEMDDRYLTTIEFSVIGKPNADPGEVP